jgi:ATP-dependent DNA helicase DinG
MVHDDEKAQIREGMDALKRGIDGFRARRPQLEMVATVAATLGRCRGADDPAGEGEHIAVIEAGTGTGKSFGALVPALVMARSRGRRLVVSSSTVALQHQYAEKDAPTLQRLLQSGFTFAVAKGRRRYACTAKLLGEASDAGQHELDIDEDDSSPPESAAVRRRRTIIIQLAESFEAERWNGDRDELAVPVPDEVWSELTTDRQGCSGSRCAEFARCPFYAARQRVKDADLVIANHDLVLSALGVDVGGVLPPPAETVYVFDEAHSLAAKAIEHMSAKHALRGAQEWLHGAVDAVRDSVLALRLDETLLRDAQLTALAAVDELEQLRQRIHGMRAFEEKRARRFKDGRLPDWMREGGGRAREAGRGLEKTFAALREAMLERAGSEGGLVTRVLAALGFYVGKLENFLATWDLMLEEEAESQIPVARWVELHDDGGTRDYLVCASPISGSERLRKLLWNRASAVVLMSATLTSCGTFDLFIRQTGLAVYRGLQFLQVESPFNYREHARLVIPAMRSEPTDAAAHTDEVIERMPQLVHSQGTLVLFASAKQMKAVHAGLPEPLRRITLVQGCMPKMEMLARHRAAIDRGDRSVLFGLQSMAEGVDLPRAYCTHVVWAKLPFSVPDSPLEEARREWIEGQGRSYFIEVTVPETAQRFKQGLGRLIRTTEDRGVVTVLDSRLLTKRWGSLLMRGIPDFEVVKERGPSAPRRAREPVAQG